VNIVSRGAIEGRLLEFRSAGNVGKELVGAVDHQGGIKVISVCGKPDSPDLIFNVYMYKVTAIEAGQ